MQQKPDSVIRWRDQFEADVKAEAARRILAVLHDAAAVYYEYNYL